MNHETKARSGSALVTVVVLTASVAILAVIALTVTASSVTEIESERGEIQALYAAESGVNAGLSQLTVSWRTGDAVSATVGDEERPAGIAQSEFWTCITDNGDETFTILATGSAAGHARTVKVIARPGSSNPFDHAMFAGNLSGDPSYELRLSGSGGQADLVTGDLYAGGDVLLEDDASVTGDLRAGGAIRGATGEGGWPAELPRLLEIDYERFHDHDVARMFETATDARADAGGEAGQLPSTSPAHIFRKNPSDRRAETSATAKDDFFLEDPYEMVCEGLGEDGSDAFLVSLPAPANNSVFFIDGNLWLHNRQTKSLKLTNDGPNPTRVTFVVKGNIYLSNNFFYDDPALDGAGFVALSDEDEADSGNIYIGDPALGTPTHAEAFLFAENNLYGNYLDATGSSSVELRGSMTAGNQIELRRDEGPGGGVVRHCRLELTFDPRQKTGLLDLPGLPVNSDDPTGFSVASWREVATPTTYPAPPTRTIRVADPAPEIDPSQGWRARWATRFPDWRDTRRESIWSRPPVGTDAAGTGSGGPGAGETGTGGTPPTDPGTGGA